MTEATATDLGRYLSELRASARGRRPAVALPRESVQGSQEHATATFGEDALRPTSCQAARNAARRTPEKYDTRRLVGALRRERRRAHGFVVLAALLLAAVLVAPLALGSQTRTRVGEVLHRWSGVTVGAP